MRALFLALYLSLPVLADTTFVDTGTGNVGSNNNMVLSGANSGIWLKSIAPSGGAQSVTAYSVGISGAVTVNGTVQIFLGGGGSTQLLSSKSITVAVGFRHLGVDTQLCTSSITATTGNGGGGLTNCVVGSVAVASGDNLWFKITIPNLSSTTLPDTIEEDTVGSTVIWPQTMFFCPTHGAACTCSGICNGASCGQQFSAGQTTTCSCDCTFCSGLAVTGPTGLVCTDDLNGHSDTCVWNNDVPGATGYFEQRSGGLMICPNVIAPPYSCQDAIGGGQGPGNWTYNVRGYGSCSPSPLAGTALPNLNSSPASTSVAIRSRYSVVIGQ